MSNSKRNCTIHQFLKTNNPALADVISGMCMEGSLKPARNTGGVTFVIPPDEVIKDMAKKANSDSDKELEDVIQLLRAYIIDGYYENPAAFEKDPPANRLGQQVVVESVSVSEVRLKNGTKLTPVAKFRTMPNRPTQAVYNASGAMPTDGPSAVRPRGRPKKTTKGGSDDSGATEGELRGRIKAAVDNKAESYFGMGQGDRKTASHPYMSAVISLMEHLEKCNDDGSKASFERALCTIDFSPYASFYLLVEPDRTNSGWTGYVVDKECLEAWEKSGSMSAGHGADAVAKYMKFLEAGQKLLKSNVRELAQAVNSQRWDIQLQGPSKTGVPKMIAAAYDQLSSSNTIGSAKVFPDSFHELIKANSKYKAWQDAARYQINYLFSYVEGNLLCHKHDFRETVDCIRDTLCGCPKNAVYTDPEFYASRVMSNEEFMAGPIGFVRSGCFLYTPSVSPGVTGAGEGDDGEDDGDDGMYGGDGDEIPDVGATAGPSTLRYCAHVL